MSYAGDLNERPAMRAVRLDGGRFAALASDLLSAGHGLRFRARGSSMRPWIRDGDLVSVDPCPPRCIRRGDVILGCNDAGRVLVHRVIRLDQAGGHLVCVTRGDALIGADAPLREEQVWGRVVAVERDGKRINLDRGVIRIVGRLWGSLTPFRCRLARTAALLCKRI